ncbi:MAG: hypothetical protein K6B70_01010 [Clostridia bacterium]|nr:hypothetical protein [Clostridia bacterium]
MNDDMANMLKNFINNMNSTNTENSSESTDNTSNSQSESRDSNNETETNNIFGNIDINTIMKMQQIMSSLNNSANDSRTNLLLSLKPYLKESRKNKVDQYIQLMKMGKVFEMMNPLGGESKHV